MIFIKNYQEKRYDQIKNTVSDLVKSLTVFFLLEYQYSHILRTYRLRLRIQYLYYRMV
jgi:hypothetical protein